MEESNWHHIQYKKKEYELYNSTERFRQIGGLVVPLLVTCHQELHDNISRVPMMDEPAMKHVIDNYEPADTYMQSYSNLIIAYERTLRHYDIDKINKQIGGIALDAIIAQRPYIKDGLVRNKIR